jgi:hypothetical protein
MSLTRFRVLDLGQSRRQEQEARDQVGGELHLEPCVGARVPRVENWAKMR